MQLSKYGTALGKIFKALQLNPDFLNDKTDRTGSGSSNQNEKCADKSKSQLLKYFTRPAVHMFKRTPYLLTVMLFIFSEKDRNSSQAASIPVTK
jgi:hypothetical protein